VLGRHYVVSTTIRFPCNEGDLWHGGLSISVQQFSAVFNDSVPLLGRSREEPGDIAEGNNGDLEGVAESNESSGFNRCVDVQTASKDLWLVRDNTDRLTLDFNKSSEDVFGVRWHNLVELVPVSHRLDSNLHIVGLVRVVRDDVVKDFSRGLIHLVDRGPRLGCFLNA
jgi:hypothetical protein